MQKRPVPEILTSWRWLSSAANSADRSMSSGKAATTTGDPLICGASILRPIGQPVKPGKMGGFTAQLGDFSRCWLGPGSLALAHLKFAEINQRRRKHAQVFGREDVRGRLADPDQRGRGDSLLAGGRSQRR